MTTAAQTKERVRCAWCGDDRLYRHYHDEEWGVPVWDDRRLFEFLLLEGAQAGLSWITILRKRDNYRRAFDGFDPVRIAGYGEKETRRLLADPGIVRNRLKIAAAVANARAFLAMAPAEGDGARFLWQFVDGEPRQPHRKAGGHLPAVTSESDAMSRELRRRGFKFVGSTICYAFMQAVGMVNDHTINCFRHAELASAAPRPAALSSGKPRRSARKNDGSGTDGIPGSARSDRRE